MQTLDAPRPSKTSRRESLEMRDMPLDPFVAFGEWFDEAQAARMIEANAMSLATAEANGAVTCRTVLLKAWNARAFVFFTNYTSQKATQLAENPRAALIFPWLALSPADRDHRPRGADHRRGIARVFREAAF